VATASAEIMPAPTASTVQNACVNASRAVPASSPASGSGIFTAAGAAERARLVTDLMTSSRISPALGVAGGRIRPEWLVPRARDAVLAAATVTLHTQLVEHDPERLGTCASARCGDVFVDASPGAHRRFCSVTCQNRERVAAFRRRRKSGS